jgi:hypothetical protein
MPNLKAVHLLPRRFRNRARCHLPAAGFFVPEERSPRRLVTRQAGEIMRGSLMNTGDGKAIQSLAPVRVLRS